MVKNMSSSTASLRKSSSQILTPLGVRSSEAAMTASPVNMSAPDKATTWQEDEFLAYLGVSDLPNSVSQTEPMVHRPKMPQKPDNSPFQFASTNPLAHGTRVDSSLRRMPSSLSSTGAVAGSPEKAKVQAVPSLSASADAAERTSSRRELDGYLPPMGSIERASLATLKEFRAELQKTFPDVSEETVPSVALTVKSYPKLFAPLQSPSLPEAQTLFHGFEAAREAESQNSEVAKLKEKLMRQEMELDSLRRWNSTLVQQRETENDDSSAFPNGSSRPAESLDVHKFDLSSIGDDSSLLSTVSNIPVKENSRASPNQLLTQVSAKSRALPFAVTSEFHNPESFAELNNRLKTGSRLSAIISNKADFRTRWANMNTGLPRKVNAQDFVKLATSSPTKEAQISPSQSPPEWPHFSEMPAQTVNPTESLTDFYNKRFESLGAEAKELIKKAQKTFMPPIVPAKKSFDPADFTKPFCDFLTENPTVFHAVDYFAKKLTAAGFEKVSHIQP